VELGLHSEASAELDEAATWYETQGLELGEEFVEEINRAFETILESPDRWSRLVAPPRRLAAQTRPPTPKDASAVEK
jgi:hypothetical protein